MLGSYQWDACSFLKGNGVGMDLWMMNSRRGGGGEAVVRMYYMRAEKNCTFENVHRCLCCLHICVCTTCMQCLQIPGSGVTDNNS